MEEKIYTINLTGNPKLVICNNNIICYLIMIKKTEFKIVCNLSTNSAKLFKRDKKSDSLEFIDIKKTTNYLVKQLREDGSRWEGDWCKEKPFGFGSFYDGEGNRLYSGFMFEGKKFGFGTEFLLILTQLTIVGILWII